MRMCRTCVGLATNVMLIAVLGTFAWASGGEGGHHGLNWWDFTLRLMNFAIMVGLLVYLLKKPLRNFFISRREGIQTTLAELEAKKVEAEKICAEYQAKLATLDQEVGQILAEYIQEGETEKRKILEAAEKQAEYLKQQAHLTIQQEVKSARESLQEEIAELTVAAAEELLRKSIKAKDQERLVKEFIAKVVEAK
jgi:F-type H+-transporting ATPase subunit b